MFKNLDTYSPEAKLVLGKIQERLTQFSSVEEIKQAMDELSDFSDTADRHEKKSLELPTAILQDRLFIEALKTASQKYPSSQEKLAALTPVHQILLGLSIKKPEHKYIFCNMHNRIQGLQNILRLQSKKKNTISS